MDSIAKEKVFVGIDVGAQDLAVVFRIGLKSQPALSFTNNIDGHAKLMKELASQSVSVVCLEATGVYSVDLSIALHNANFPLMVINPMKAHNFTKVLGKHSKTDNVDADSLAQYGQLMPFVQWVCPSVAAITLRAFARRLNALAKEKAAAKNQSHAMSFVVTTPASVIADLALSIKQLEDRIASLTRDSIAFVKADPAISQPFALLLTVKGIAQASAIALLGEILLIPNGLTPRQWVKFAGLDPQQFRSGTSVEKKTRISKAGNHYIRAALFMPALSAKTHDPHVKAYFEHLIAMQKTPLQGICAVMRKLIHAIHGMLTNNAVFDNTRFYKIPKDYIAKTAKIA